VSTTGSSNNLEATIAHRLRAARRRAGLSQTEAAKRLGVRPNTISGWEAGTRMPRAPELFELSALYDCSTDYLVCRCAHPGMLPVGEILVDTDLVESILRARSEAEIAKLVDWDPQLVTIWHVVRRGTRVSSRTEVQTLLSRLSEHVQAVAPGLWREYGDRRRNFMRGREEPWTTTENEGDSES
jgi:transcriptional regulator with XRE-family HTH domain